MINNKGKGKLRLSLRKGGISGQIDTATTGRERIIQINQGHTTLRSSTQSSESRCIKYWKKLRMNHSSND